jgi:RNA polymerase sigma factor (sigma-70 family)
LAPTSGNDAEHKQKEKTTMSQLFTALANPDDFDRQYNKLVAVLKKRGFNHHDAEDLAIEALVKGLKEETLDNPNAWLFKTALNGGWELCRDWEMANKHLEALAYHLARIRDDEARSPVAEAVRHEEVNIAALLVPEALGTLADLDRVILTLHVLIDATIKELSEWFNLTPGAIKGRLQRSKARLRRYLENRLGDKKDNST